MRNRLLNVVLWVGGLLLLLASTVLRAAPVATAEGGGIKITLTDEKCKLAAVSNLPSRAVWTQDGKYIEGCYGSDGNAVLFYFADKTVVALSILAFTPLKARRRLERGTET